MSNFMFFRANFGHKDAPIAESIAHNYHTQLIFLPQSSKWLAVSLKCPDTSPTPTDEAYSLERSPLSQVPARYDMAFHFRHRLNFLDFQGIGRSTALLFAKEGAKVVASECVPVLSVQP